MDSGKENAVADSSGCAAVPAQRSQIAVVVVGAGRSGTSAITRGLQAIGVELGEGLRPGGGKNPTGFFENQNLLSLNQRLKRALGIRGDSVRLIEGEEWETPPVRSLQREAVETIRRDFSDVPLWGYKYGRTLRLLPFWLAVYEKLDLDVRYVVALRNPLSVARSRAKLDPRRGTQEKSDLEWLVNIVPYFRHVAERTYVVVDYDRILSDPLAELDRMAATLDLPTTSTTKEACRAYAEEFLVQGMRHSRFTVADLQDAAVHPLVRDAYRWLDLLGSGTSLRNSGELWQDWHRIERSVAELAPLLRHIDRVEDDYRRAQRNPLSPLALLAAALRRRRPNR